MMKVKERRARMVKTTRRMAERTASLSSIVPQAASRVRMRRLPPEATKPIFTSRTLHQQVPLTPPACHTRLLLLWPRRPVLSFLLSTLF